MLYKVAVASLAIVSLFQTAHALQCYTCRSDNLAACATLSVTPPSAECAVGVNECYSYVENGITVRGCEAPSSGCANGQDCAPCTGDLCNGQTFPTDRLTCHQCTGVECLAPTAAPLACENYTPTDTCYSVFSIDGKEAYRGCSSDASEKSGSQFCAEHDQQCERCQGANCNSRAVALVNNQLSCLKCTSDTDLNCVQLQTQLSATVCQQISSGYTDSCYVHVANETVRRGCLSEQLTEIEAECKDSRTCELCVGNECNAKVIESESCYECDSELDANCRTQPNASMATTCPLSVNKMGCFRYGDGGDIVKRGCLNTVTVFEVNMCRQEGQFCKTCTGTNCNQKVDFQQCRACSSANSVSCIRSPGSFAAVTCRSYIDECFVHVENDVVTRGCLQQSSTPVDVQQRCASPSEMCEKCSNEQNCNNKIVDGEFCLTCDSELDENCGSNLNYTMRTQCPLSVSPRGCYRYHDGGSIIKRGCVGDLVNDEQNMCRSQGQFCKTCIGNDCNEKVSFQQCRACNSTNSVNCIRSPGSFAAVTCRNYLDECFVHVENDVVSRGCLQQTSVPQVQTDCQGENNDFCEKCSSGSNCNNRIVDGEFCLTCDSEVDPNCRNNLSHTLRTQCPLAVRPRGCYLYNDGGDIVKRGCLGDVIPQEVAMCRQQGQYCKTCIGNDCNEKVSFQQCRVCNSTNSVNCIRSPGSFASVTCRNYLDECFAHVENNVVSRGCLQQTSVPQVQTDCSGENNDFCEKCSSGSNCNNRIVDGEFCLTCDSEEDPNCRNNLNHTLRTQCPLAVRPRGCYLYNDGGDIVKRGCLGDVIPQEVTMCRRQGQYCKTCIGNDCNEKVSFQQCRVCNSTNSVNCIRSPGSFAAVMCRNYLDECFAHVENNVVTRGCLQQTNVPQVQTDCQGENNDFCEKCSSGSNCNNRIVDGEFCLTCDSEVDPSCRDNLNHTLRTQCPLAVRPRGCYLYNDGGDIVKRGCLGDVIPQEVAMCRQQGQYCKTCIGNDCNEKVSFQQCRVCNSVNSVSCIRSPGSFASVTCRNYLDECFAHVENDVVSRGCLQQTADPQVQTDCQGENNDFCDKCSSGSNCNNRIVDGEFCLTCDSTADPNCRENLNYTMRTQCPLAVRPRGCYLFADGGDIGGDSDLVRRGCIGDIVAQEVSVCRQQGQFCKTCIGNDCNEKVAFQRCRSCNSTINVNCLNSPDTFAPTLCRSYSDSCYVHVDKDIVSRGCLEDSTAVQVHINCATANTDICETCDGANCNNQLVNEEFCITCDSESDSNCALQSNETMSTKCELAIRPRGCYRFDDGGDIVKRGCLSDVLPQEVQMCRAEGQYCKTCLGNDCNQKAEFQRCRACSSADSVNCIRSPGSFAAVTCRNYLDECFVHVADDVVTRGCLQQSTTAIAVQQTCQTNNDFCDKCSNGPSCNNKIVDGEFCLTCDSGVDENCQTNLNFTMRTQCPLSVNPRGCYRYDDGGDIIKRGCVGDISGYEVAMCRQQGQFCKTCYGNDCNEKVNFQQCKVCNSAQNVDCIRSTNFIGSQTCRNYDDDCFVHVKDDLIQRGCLKSNVNLESDCQNVDVCEKCTDLDDCNDKVVDGEFCITCDSEVDPNCRDSLNTTMRTQCTLAVAKMGCYLFNDGGETVKRGCISDIHVGEQQMCRNNRDYCKTCMGNDCNKELTFRTCYVCNSSTDPDCITPTSSTPTKICANYFDQCLTHIEGDNVIRGCADEYVGLVIGCAESENCELCVDGELCNAKNVAEEFCYECDSEVDANCREQLNATMSISCSGEGLSLKRQGCYRYDDTGDIVKRGCLIDLEPYEINMCRNEATFCKTCQENNCNQKVAFQTCYACNSNTSTNCLDNAVAVLEPKTCRQYTDTCSTIVTADGQTERDCSSEIRAVAIRTDTCATSNCNSNVFPADRKRCHQCSGVECNQLVQDSDVSLQLCSNYDVNERCYAYLNNQNEMSRGCASDNNQAKITCDELGTACVYCDASGCNSQPAQLPATLSCIQCSGTAECQWGFSPGRATICTAAVSFSAVESCYSLTLTSGLVTRGCTLEASTQCAGDTCQVCSGTACNGRNVATQSCLSCKSDVVGQANCGDADQTTAFSNQCNVATFVEYADRGCFTRNDDGVIVRGCAVELSSELRADCEDGDFESCVYCVGENCNSLTPPSSAQTFGALSVVTMLLLVLFQQQLS